MKKEYPCPFKDYCQIYSEACKTTDVAWCPEAKKIKEILETPCPVMISAGYRPENDVLGTCMCNIPQIRLRLPAGTPCNPDGKCISETFDKETKKDVFSIRDDNPIIKIKKTLATQIAKKISDLSRKTSPQH